MTDKPRAADSAELAAFKAGIADFPRRNRHDLQSHYDAGWHAAGDYWDEVRPDHEEVMERRARLAAVNIGEVFSAGYRGR